MNGNPAIGIAIAALIDVLVPIALIVPTVWANHRRRTSRLTDGRFWFGTGMYVLAVAILVGFAVADVLAYRGLGVVIAVFGAFPLGLVPAIANSNLIAQHFTLAEWTHFGYATVLLIFVIGLVPWAALGPILIRRVLQVIRPKLPPLAQVSADGEAESQALVRRLLAR
ncbi:MAG: hypothetical protein ABIQ01_00480 [Pseudolysinimonas sp.]